MPKRDRGDYFKQRRARLKAERDALEAQTKPPTDGRVKDAMTIRLSQKAVRAMDDARQGGLFERSRSQFMRDALVFYIKSGAP